MYLTTLLSPRKNLNKIHLHLSLSAPKSQRFLRFAIAMPIADPRNRAISKTRQCNVALRFKGAMEVASDLRFRAAISEAKTPFFCGISGDLAQSTRKSLAIAIVRFWCAKRSFHNPGICIVIIRASRVCNVFSECLWVWEARFCRRSF